MVKIRLTRTGRKHQPHYRIVAVDSRAKRDGKYIEKIGYYNPRTVPPTFQINKEILKKWMDNGAQLTDTVYDLLLREKIITKKDKLREKRIKLMIEQNKSDKENQLQKNKEKSIPESVKKVETQKHEPDKGIQKPKDKTSDTKENGKKEAKGEKREPTKPKPKSDKKEAKLDQKSKKPEA